MNSYPGTIVHGRELDSYTDDELLPLYKKEYEARKKEANELADRLGVFFQRPLPKGRGRLGVPAAVLEHCMDAPTLFYVGVGFAYLSKRLLSDQEQAEITVTMGSMTYWKRILVTEDFPAIRDFFYCQYSECP